MKKECGNCEYFKNETEWCRFKTKSSLSDSCNFWKSSGSNYELSDNEEDFIKKMDKNWASKEIRTLPSQNNKLIIEKKKTLIESGSPEDLQALAERKATEILQKIGETNARIAEAKEEADSAKAMKSGWFGKTGKKADATANAVVATNAALSEMNNLIQESVRFTCASIQFAQVMHKTMSYMMVKGFRDNDGNVKKLAGDSKKFAQQILDEADNFVQKQLKVENKQAELMAKLKEKDKIDREQSYRLENLQRLLAEKGQVDEKQEEEIRLLVEYTKQKDVLDKKQNENIQKIMEKLQPGITRKKTALALSIIALIISVGALAFSVLCLYLR
jgi:hypothetical protein